MQSLASETLQLSYGPICIILQTNSLHPFLSASLPHSCYRFAKMGVERPLLLYAATPSEGHMVPTLQIVGHLVSRGYEVGVVSSANWRDSILQCGAEFFPTLGIIETLRLLTTSYPHAYAAFLGLETNLHANQTLRARGECFFIEVMPSSLESVRSALMTMKRAQPDREMYVFPSCLHGRASRPTYAGV